MKSPNSTLKKSLSVLLSACLLWTSGSLSEASLYVPQLLQHPGFLPQFDLNPPDQLGRVVDYYNASAQGPVPSPQSNARASSSGLVILIQDLHAHYGVQKNIAGILEFLDKKLKSHPSSLALGPGPSALPFKVAVEGAAGPIDSSVMALFPDQQIKQQALDYLMHEGELTGMEYFAAMHNQPSLLVGVEDARYYNIHRELFRKTMATRSELVHSLNGLQRDILALRPRLYSSELKKIQTVLDNFDKGRLTTEEFVAELATRAGPARKGQGWKKDFPDFAAFANNLGIRNQGSAVSREELMLRPAALRALTTEFMKGAYGYLTAEERQNLSALAKQPNTDAYYAYVRELIYSHQLFMAAPPELSQYLEVLHTSQSMSLDRVLHQARELAFRIKRQHTTTKAEKDLVQVEHDLGLLLRVADLQATEMEVRDFGPRINQFVALADSLLANTRAEFRISAAGAPPAASTSLGETQIRQLISSSIDYYVMALMRNKPMVDNTLALLGSPESRVLSPESKKFKKFKRGSPTAKLSTQHSALSTVVLVAGGFHTAPITQMLRARNVSYVVITPSVDQITQADHDLYVKRLGGTLLSTDEIVAAARGTATHEPTRLAFLHPGSGLAVGLFLYGVPHMLDFAAGRWMIAHHVDWAGAVLAIAGFLLVLPALSQKGREMVRNWKASRIQQAAGQLKSASDVHPAIGPRAIASSDIKPAEAIPVASPSIPLTEDVEQLLERANIPPETKQYARSLIRRATTKFDLGMTSDLLRVLIDPRLSDRVILLIDRFIDKEGVTELIHRIATGWKDPKGLQSIKGAVGELEAAAEILDSHELPYPTELERFGESFTTVEGRKRQVIEFDGILRGPDGKWRGILEAKNGELADTEKATKWLVSRKALDIGKKLARLREIIRSNGEFKVSEEDLRKLDDVDDLIVAITTPADEQKRIAFQEALKSFEARVNAVLAQKEKTANAIEPGNGKPYKIKIRIVWLKTDALFDSRGRGIEVVHGGRPYHKSVEPLSDATLANVQHQLAEIDAFTAAIYQETQQKFQAIKRDLNHEIVTQLGVTPQQAGTLSQYLMREVPHRNVHDLLIQLISQIGHKRLAAWLVELAQEEKLSQVRIAHLQEKILTFERDRRLQRQQVRAILETAEQPYDAPDPAILQLPPKVSSNRANLVRILEDALQEDKEGADFSFDPSTILIGIGGSLAYLIDQDGRPYWPAIGSKDGIPDADLFFYLPDGTLTNRQRATLKRVLEQNLLKQFGGKLEITVVVTNLSALTHTAGVPYLPTHLYIGAPDVLQRMRIQVRDHRDIYQQKALETYSALFEQLVVKRPSPKNDPLKTLKWLFQLARIRGDHDEAQTLFSLIKITVTGTLLETDIESQIAQSVQRARPLFERSEISSLVEAANTRTDQTDLTIAAEGELAGGGMHAVGGRDFDVQDLAVLDRVAQSRIKGGLKGSAGDLLSKDRTQLKQWSEDLKRIINQPDEAAATVFGSFPELRQELQALADLIVKSNPQITRGTDQYKVQFITTSSPDDPMFVTPSGLSVPAFGYRDDVARTIRIYIRDLPSLIHEGLEHAILPNPRKGRTSTVPAVQVHTLAYYAEGLAAGQPKNVDLPDGTKVNVSIPRRAREEIAAMSPEKRTLFVAGKSAAIDQVNGKFNTTDDEAARRYGLGMVEALNALAQTSETNPPSSSSSGSRVFGLLASLLIPLTALASWALPGRAQIRVPPWQNSLVERAAPSPQKLTVLEARQAVEAALEMGIKPQHPDEIAVSVDEQGGLTAEDPEQRIELRQRIAAMNHAVNFVFDKQTDQQLALELVSQMNGHSELNPDQQRFVARALLLMPSRLNREELGSWLAKAPVNIKVVRQLIAEEDLAKLGLYFNAVLNGRSEEARLLEFINIKISDAAPPVRAVRRISHVSPSRTALGWALEIFAWLLTLFGLTALSIRVRGLKAKTLALHEEIQGLQQVNMQLEDRNIQLAEAVKYHQRQNLELNSTIIQLKQEITKRERDPITGLPGLTVQERMLRALVDQAERSRRVDEPPFHFTVLSIDLDKFKWVNDTFGNHRAGDVILKAVGEILQSQLERAVDVLTQPTESFEETAIREHGDEFKVLLPYGRFNGGVAVAKKILNAIDQQLDIAKILAENNIAIPPGIAMQKIGASIGVYEYRPGDTPESINEAADHFMYAAKGAGRNQYAPQEEPLSVRDGAPEKDLSDGKADVAQVVRQWARTGVGELVLQAENGTSFTFRYFEERSSVNTSLLNAGIEIYVGLVKVGLAHFQMNADTREATIGTALVGHRELGGAAGRPTEVSEALFVDPKFRDAYRGIGSSLTSLILQVAKAKGMSRLRGSWVFAPDFFITKLGFLPINEPGTKMLFPLDDKTMADRGLQFPPVKISVKPANPPPVSQSPPSGGGVEKPSGFLPMSRPADETAFADNNGPNPSDPQSNEEAQDRLAWAGRNLEDLPINGRDAELVQYLQDVISYHRQFGLTDESRSDAFFQVGTAFSVREQRLVLQSLQASMPALMDSITGVGSSIKSMAADMEPHYTPQLEKDYHHQLEVYDALINNFAFSLDLLNWIVLRRSPGATPAETALADEIIDYLDRLASNGARTDNIRAEAVYHLRSFASQNSPRAISTFLIHALPHLEVSAHQRLVSVLAHNAKAMWNYVLRSPNLVIQILSQPGRIRRVGMRKAVLFHIAMNLLDANRSNDEMAFLIVATLAEETGLLEELISNSALSPQVRIYAFNTYVHGYQRVDDKALDFVRMLAPTAERLMRDFVAHGDIVRGLTQNIYLQHEVGQIYAIAPLITMQAHLPLMNAREFSSVANIFTRTKVRSYYFNSYLHGGDHVVGGGVPKFSSTPNQFFLETEAHEAMHAILEYRFGIRAVGLFARTFHEILADAHAMEFSRLMGFSPVNYFDTSSKFMDLDTLISGERFSVEEHERARAHQKQFFRALHEAHLPYDPVLYMKITLEVLGQMEKGGSLELQGDQVLRIALADIQGEYLLAAKQASARESGQTRRNKPEDSQSDKDAPRDYWRVGYRALIGDLDAVAAHWAARERQQKIERGVLSDTPIPADFKNMGLSDRLIQRIAQARAQGITVTFDGSLPWTIGGIANGRTITLNSNIAQVAPSVLERIFEHELLHVITVTEAQKPSEWSVMAMEAGSTILTRVMSVLFITAVVGVILAIFGHAIASAAGMVALTTAVGSAAEAMRRAPPANLKDIVNPEFTSLISELPANHTDLVIRTQSDILQAAILRSA